MLEGNSPVAIDERQLWPESGGAAKGSERTEVTAGNYELVVRGRLSPTLAAAFEGFDIARVEHGATHLIGWVRDQCRLHGTLELLRDLNIELISLNAVPTSEPRRRRDDF
jgi:hypothetical protein